MSRNRTPDFISMAEERRYNATVARKTIAQQEMDRLTSPPNEATPLVRPERLDSMALSESHASLLISMTFMSRTEGVRPHVVGLRLDGTTYCTCQANPTYVCWAQRAFRMVAGMQ